MEEGGNVGRAWMQGLSGHCMEVGGKEDRAWMWGHIWTMEVGGKVDRTWIRGHSGQSRKNVAE
jgi:hypothetical protein